MVQTPMPAEIYWSSRDNSRQIARQIFDYRGVPELLENGPLLEAGCGIGNILEAISNFSPDTKLIGVDSIGEYVDEARERLDGRADIYHANIVNMDMLESGSVPVVLTHNVYKPFNSSEVIRDMVGEIFRVMPVGGVYFCYDGGYDEHAGYLEEFGCEPSDWGFVFVKKK